MSMDYSLRYGGSYALLTLASAPPERRFHTG